MCIYVQFFLSTPEFFPEWQIFLPKNNIFGDFGGRKATFFIAIAVKFGTRVWSWGSLPQAKYCKNGFRGCTPFWQIYTKNTNFGNFGGCTPTFLTDSDTIWHEGANLGRPPQAKFCKNRLRGYTFWGKFIPKITSFRDFGGCKPTF